MAYVEKSFIGNGKIWLRRRGTTNPMREIGNCSALTLGVETEESSLQNYRGGGGEINSRERISAVNLTVTAHDFSAENMALAIRGEASSVASGAVSAEEHPGVASGLIRTDKLIDLEEPISVTGPSGDPVYVRGEDYAVSAAGIEIIAGGDITGSGNIEITYVAKSSTLVGALMNAGEEFEMVFDGLNEAQGGEPVVIDIWRAKAGAADELSLIGDDYGALNLPFSLLLDTSKEQAGQSGYFEVNSVA